MKKIVEKRVAAVIGAVLLTASLNAATEMDHSQHNHGEKAAKESPATEYPLTTCVVSGEALEEGYKSIQYQGQEVRFCCNGCKKDFYKDPEQYMKKLKAGKDGVYPLTTCVISGEELGSMGEPYVFNYEGTEVQFCCGGCKKKFLANPEKHLSTIRAAKEGTTTKKMDGHSDHDHSGHNH